jgi:hypothetical protein
VLRAASPQASTLFIEIVSPERWLSIRLRFRRNVDRSRNASVAPFTLSSAPLNPNRPALSYHGGERLKTRLVPPPTESRAVRPPGLPHRAARADQRDAPQREGPGCLPACSVCLPACPPACSPAPACLPARLLPPAPEVSFINCKVGESGRLQGCDTGREVNATDHTRKG